MFFFPLAAASCLIELAVKESDNNVKLIVIDRLDALRSKHDHVIDALVLDVLRILTRLVQCYQSLDGLIENADLLLFIALTSKSARSACISLCQWSLAGMSKKWSFS